MAFKKQPAKGTGHATTHTPDANHLTGFDFMSQWSSELPVIMEHGPFSAEEVGKLSAEQMADYFYVTSWILRQEGRDGFLAVREELRGLLLRRLQAGERLNPLA